VVKKAFVFAGDDAPDVFFGELFGRRKAPLAIGGDLCANEPAIGSKDEG
jgi:hypothetical protein